MARRRRDQPEEENVDLEGPEHAWWTSSPIDPFERDEPVAPEADPEPEPEPEPEPQAETDAELDPYRVLRVDPTAHWEDIVLAYRKLARWWHPDGLVDATDDEREACELRIRELNDAYQKLRVRRGR